MLLSLAFCYREGLAKVGYGAGRAMALSRVYRRVKECFTELGQSGFQLPAIVTGSSALCKDERRYIVLTKIHQESFHGNAK